MPCIMMFPLSMIDTVLQGNKAGIDPYTFCLVERG